LPGSTLTIQASSPNKNDLARDTED